MKGTLQLIHRVLFLTKTGRQKQIKKVFSLLCNALDFSRSIDWLVEMSVTKICLLGWFLYHKTSTAGFTFGPSMDWLISSTQWQTQIFCTFCFCSGLRRARIFPTCVVFFPNFLNAILWCIFLGFRLLVYLKCARWKKITEHHEKVGGTPPLSTDPAAVPSSLVVLYKEGTLVAVRMPFAWVPLYGYEDSVCCRCSLGPCLVEVSRCSGCKVAHYCSPGCQVRG